MYNFTKFHNIKIGSFLVLAESKREGTTLRTRLTLLRLLKKEKQWCADNYNGKANNKEIIGIRTLKGVDYL